VDGVRQTAGEEPKTGLAIVEHDTLVVETQDGLGHGTAAHRVNDPLLFGAGRQTEHRWLPFARSVMLVEEKNAAKEKCACSPLRTGA
jgi:hypothetical protein